ncbi:MAG TPA: hypothetical protein VES42_27260 [Pilimelia sp.]|nr:hypothetical protein [Pilimelia sp.]
MDADPPDIPTVYHTGGRRPFDPWSPPEQPPAACVDPALWRLAYALHRAHRPRSDGRCGCAERHPCATWWQAVAGLAGACADITGDPRPFALCDRDGDVLAYGMTLPDASAVTVEWSGGRLGAFGVWSSPAAPARLWGCGIAWYGRPSAQPPTPR